MGRRPMTNFMKNEGKWKMGEEITLWIEIYWVARQNGTLNNFAENHNHRVFMFCWAWRVWLKELAWKEQFFCFFEEAIGNPEILCYHFIH